MAAGSGATVIVAVPLIPSTVAVMVAVPAATAETVPVAETVATAGVLLLHVTARPVSDAPAASRAVAVSACTPPITREAVAGVTTTEATGTVVVGGPPPGFTGVVPPPSEQAIMTASITVSIFAQRVAARRFTGTITSRSLSAVGLHAVVNVRNT